MPKYRFDEIAINSTEKKKPTDEDKETYIGLEHLDSGSLYVKRWGSSVPIKGEKLVMRKGDVLLGKRNAYLRRAAIAPHDGIFSAHGMVLRPKEDVIDRDFFPLFIASDYFFDTAVRISVGSLSPTVNWKDLKVAEFELPSLEEQRKLAKALWAVIRTIEAYKELIEKTDELVKSQFIEMFVGHDYPNIRLDQLASITSGLTKNPKRPTYKMKMPYLRVANVLFNTIDISDIQDIGVLDNEIEKTLLEKGDLLFVEGNGSPEQIGRVAVWDGKIERILHQNHIIKARFDKEKILPEYAMHYYMSKEGRQQIIDNAKTTSGLYTLSLGKISSFTLPLPPLSVQKTFMQFIMQTDKSKFELTQALEALNATYKKLISENLG